MVIMMTVPTYKRKEGKLLVLNSAIIIHNTIIRLVKNEELFPKRYSEILTKPFIDNSRNVMYYIRNANEVKKVDEETINLRRGYINKAIFYANNLYVDIQTNLEFNPQNIDKYTFLLEELDKLLNLLGKWS